MSIANQSNVTAFVGRQPIFTPKRNTYAYELLFRSSEENFAVFDDAEAATAELLLNTFLEIGLERIVGNRRAFINISEKFLLGGFASSLPQSRVVLEVLETVRPTPEVLSALAQLRQDGYTIAIDDFVYSPELMPLVELADIVKVDLPEIDAEQLPQHVDILKQQNVRILAEKVETEEEFEKCKELGFNYFQGYFFSRPTVIRGKQLPTNRLTMVQLLARLQRPQVSLQEIADIVRTEPALSLKLFRFVNSAYCGLSQKVESVQHAVALAGLKRIKTIASLTIMSQAAQGEPAEFMRTVLVRARMAELLATKMQADNVESYFLTGLFSALDTLLHMPLEEALELVSVSEEVEAALKRRSGPIGQVLNAVMQYEKGNWDNASVLPVDDNDIRDTYLEAIEWATITGQL